MQNLKIKLTVVVPSIRPDKWLDIFHKIEESCNTTLFEVIAIGPNLCSNELNNELRFRYIRDFGSPARSFQLASTVANGKYITWMPDDSIVEANAYHNCVELMETKTKLDGMTILYSEGINFVGQQHNDPSYWMARTHDGLRFAFVEEHWRIAPIFLYNLEYFREIGGLDCRFEHINMNAHDLAFRVQRSGGVIYDSPSRVLSLNWIPWGPINKSPIQISYEENDEPLFKQIFSSAEERPIKIDYNNWKEADIFWKRRYEQIN